MREVATLGIGPLDAVVGLSASGRTPYVVGALSKRDGPGRSRWPWSRSRSPSSAAWPSTRSRSSSAPSHRRLDAAEGRHRAEARAQHDLDDRDGPARKDVRRPDGRRGRDERQAARARAADRRRSATGAAPRRRSTRRSTAADGDAKVAIVSLLAGIDADAARARLDAADGVVREALRAMKLGVAAALVDGRLVPATSRSSTAVSRRRPRSPRPRDRGAGLRRPAGERLRRLDFLDADAGGLRRAGEALLETGVTAYLPTFITSPEEDVLAALAEVPLARAGRAFSACTSRARSSPRDGSGRIRARTAATRPRAARAAARGGPGAADDARTGAARRTRADRRPARRAASSSRSGTATRPPTQATRVRPRRATVTHLFNAMRPLSTAIPGIVGAALARDDVVVQMIVDGIHLRPDDVARAGARRRGPRRARHRCGRRRERARADLQPRQRRAQRADGGVPARPHGMLAGSAVTMIEAVRNLHRARRVRSSRRSTPPRAVPARVLGLRDRPPRRRACPRTSSCSTTTSRSSACSSEGRRMSLPEPAAEPGARLPRGDREQPAALRRLLEHDAEFARVAAAARERGCARALRRPRLVRQRGDRTGSTRSGCSRVGRRCATRSRSTVYYDATLDLSGSTVSASRSRDRRPTSSSTCGARGSAAPSRLRSRTIPTRSSRRSPKPCRRWRPAPSSRSLRRRRTSISSPRSPCSPATSPATGARSPRASAAQPKPFRDRFPALGRAAATLALPFCYRGRMFVIGRGREFATAREIALKLLETCRVAAEPLTATDLAHGPVAALDPLFPVWAIASPRRDAAGGAGGGATHPRVGRDDRRERHRGGLDRG